ncbi:hypothetical protein L202_04133 [Cryptococcus amylolentus CBS 6039]|uniref:Uncharacterized protein n=2 Tax=Cryptococcus amylolentus TaxID=104669 RepID=A0A1E3HS40_9TREE|nr:hypothetical protein L202_04133 [Cryptococcus amylolentus CBS 6039]ODN78506.1 hypothetical protein L202_04133 [Cryptococcus amylolentus CBS 6039]ODO06920.1 hypothetical protein I350_04281 [Cryptococcus amylolentus CBS 6273]
MSYIVSVPAGRCHRREENSNWVDPQAEKGAIQLRLEDDLLRFAWRSRENHQVDEELIIFPGEATFEKVTQDPTGRTHILKFSSSNQKYFFWFQRKNKDGDLRAQVDINNLLQDPSYQPGSAALPPQQEQDWPPTPGAPRLSNPEPAPSTSAEASSSTAPEATQENMARLLAEWARGGALGQAEDPARLTDVLSPSNIATLITSNPSLIPTITPLLPPGLSLPENPKAEDIIPVLSAPQFNDAIASLDNALRSGGLPGGMMRELGLPESAGQSVKGFLDGLLGLKKEDDRMDED